MTLGQPDQEQLVRALQRCGICNDGPPDDDGFAFDDLRIVSSESVPVVSLEDTESTSCLNYH